MRKIILFIFLFISTITSFAGNDLHLEGQISKKYNGCEAHLVSRNQKILPVKTTISNGKFRLSANLINEYEMLYLFIQKAGTTLGSIHFISAPGNIKVVVKADGDIINANEIILSNASFQVVKKAYDLLCKNAADTLSVLYNKIVSKKNSNW